MNYLSKYIIPYIGLADGIHDFEFTIDKDFFSEFDCQDQYKGEIPVKVVFEKKSHIMKIDFSIEGNVELECDRCLDFYNQKITGESSLYVKIGSERDTLADDVIVVSTDDYEIQISQYIYELFCFSLPFKKVHPSDKAGNYTCNKEMLEKIKQHTAIVEEKTIDPRWDSLKKLIDNK